jgi:hypothetical protein
MIAPSPGHTAIESKREDGVSHWHSWRRLRAVATAFGKCEYRLLQHTTANNKLLAPSEVEVLIVSCDRPTRAFTPAPRDQ